MCESKSNFGTGNIDSHGTGPLRIDHGGTGRPGMAIDGHGTGGLPSPAIDSHGTGRPGALGRMLLGALFVVGAATATAETRHLQTEGLSLSVNENRVTMSWIETDGRLAVASGTHQDGFARIPVSLIALDETYMAKVQGTGSGAPGGSSYLDPVEPVAPQQPVERRFEYGVMEVVLDETVAGTVLLAFDDGAEKLAFSFDEEGGFLHRSTVGE